MSDWLRPVEWEYRLLGFDGVFDSAGTDEAKVILVVPIEEVEAELFITGQLADLQKERMVYLIAGKGFPFVDSRMVVEIAESHRWYLEQRVKPIDYLALTREFVGSR